MNGKATWKLGDWETGNNWVLCDGAQYHDNEYAFQIICFSIRWLREGFQYETLRMIEEIGAGEGAGGAERNSMDWEYLGRRIWPAWYLTKGVRKHMISRH